MRETLHFPSKYIRSKSSWDAIQTQMCTPWICTTFIVGNLPSFTCSYFISGIYAFSRPAVSSFTGLKRRTQAYFSSLLPSYKCLLRVSGKIALFIYLFIWPKDVAYAIFPAKTILLMLQREIPLP